MTWPSTYYSKGFILLFILSVAALPATVCAQPRAFPTAEGGGMYASGGRGGRVLFVTSLNDSDEPGTLRYALSRPGKRIVLFQISGTIFLNSPLYIRYGDLTIAGQTAPRDGICIANYPVTLMADNVIVRYLRFRMGYHGTPGADGADAFGGRQLTNVIIDHCSISWSTDECSSFYDNEDFTFQWCIVSESLRLSAHSKGAHGYGAIWGGVNASFHHNLLAHHDSRTPRFGPGDKHAGKDKTDARNNVFYNWNGNGCYGGEAMDINIVNNYYKPGPATGRSVSGRIIAINAKDGRNGFSQIKGVWGKYYIQGNVVEDNAAVTNENWRGVDIVGNSRDPIKADIPVATTAVKTYSALTAYSQVLAYAGCSKSRDEVDRRIIEESRSGRATYSGLSPRNDDFKNKGYPKPGIIDNQMDLRPQKALSSWSPWPLLQSSPALADTDMDGMPDAWETLRGLNYQTADANRRDLDPDYDNIEIYINELVSLIP